MSPARNVVARLAHNIMLAATIGVTLVLALIRPRRRIPLRSLWAGTPILTLPTKARAERLLGVDAESLAYLPYHLGGGFDYNLSRWFRVPILRSLLPYAVFCWACWRFDRFHFFCDQGLLPQRVPRYFNAAELKLYRRLGKQLFLWTYGADVRAIGATKSLGEPNCCTHCPQPERYCICNDARGRDNFDNLRRHATAIFAMGDMIEYTPGSVNDVFFWPVELEALGGGRYAPRYPEPGATSTGAIRALRVVHASNHRFFKGTDHLVAAVDALRREGQAIDLVLVEGVSNDRALEMYREADVIFDQCLIGFHGYLAQEAMALGKPVMAFVRKPREYLLAPEECPIINTPSDRIEQVLRDLLADRSRVHELGRRGRAYIEKHHSLQAFAARLARAYERLGVTTP